MNRSITRHSAWASSFARRSVVRRNDGHAVRKELQLNNRIVSITGAVAVACAVISPSGASGQCDPAWSALGSGASGGLVAANVDALTVFDDGSGGGPALYAGGAFTTAGGVTVNSIAKWDGAAWSALGSGMTSAGGGSQSVAALTVFDDGSGAGSALYAGGTFPEAGGVPVNRIAKWDGAAWSPLGTGMSGGVFALTVFDVGSGGGPALYAAGTFTTAGGVGANRIAKWDGTAWSALGSGMDFGVFALTVFDDGSGAGPALYAAGSLTTAGGVSAMRIAKWDGAAWSALGSGMDFGVSVLNVFDDGSGPALYAGGNFETAGGVPVNRIAKWDGSAWSALGSGTNNVVDALGVFDDGSGGGPALYAGGDFTTAGGLSASRVARWGSHPTACYADCDCSGDLDFFDFLCFQNLFAAGDPEADCDDSGSLDFFDFLCFQNEFAAGCS